MTQPIDIDIDIDTYRLSQVLSEILKNMLLRNNPTQAKKDTYTCI